MPLPSHGNSINAMKDLKQIYWR